MYRAILLTMSLLGLWSVPLDAAKAGSKIAEKQSAPTEVRIQGRQETGQQQDVDWRKAQASANGTSAEMPAQRKDELSLRDRGGPTLPPVYW